MMEERRGNDRAIGRVETQLDDLGAEFRNGFKELLDRVTEGQISSAHNTDLLESLTVAVGEERSQRLDLTDRVKVLERDYERRAERTRLAWRVGRLIGIGIGAVCSLYGLLTHYFRGLK